MADAIPFSALDVPAPLPYDSKYPDQQRENFYYVLNQVLLHAQAAGWQLPDPKEFWQAIEDLKFIQAQAEFGNVKVKIFGVVEEQA